MPEVTAIVEEPSGELREIQVSVSDRREEVYSPLTDIPIKYLGSYKFVNGLLLLFQKFPESKIKIVDGSDFYVYGSDRSYTDKLYLSDDEYGLLKEWDWDRDYDLTKDEPFATGWMFSIYDSVDYADYKDIED